MKALKLSYGVAVTTLAKNPRHPSHLLPQIHNFDQNPHQILNLFSKRPKIFNLLLCNYRPYSSSGPHDPISVSPTVSPPNSHQDDGVSSIDAGNSLRKPISLWPGMYHSPVTNALWQARSIFDTTPETVDVESITSKTPAHSRTTILYPFSSDYILREQYRNPWNGIRVGKLLEDLDALAGTISFKVCVFLFFIMRLLLDWDCVIFY